MSPIRAALAASVVAIVAAPVAWQLAREQGGILDPVAAPEPAVAGPAMPPDSSPEPAIHGSEAPKAERPRESPARQRSAAPAQNVDARSLPAPGLSAAPPPPAAARAETEGKLNFRFSGGPRFGEWEADVGRHWRLGRGFGFDTSSPAVEPIDRFEGEPQGGFKVVVEAPVSTFSIDVDTAAYGYLRASLAGNVLPPPEAIRTEELVNYFPYAYPVPESRDAPFRVTASVFPSPWAPERKILRVGIKSYDIPAEARPKANLVFLVDTSGSMAGPNRLPLVKQSLALLLTRLDARDRVAIVAYAGEAGTVLEPTPASDKRKILAAIEGLGAGGGTAGGEGLRQAYALAERNYDRGAVNRVMLATDGDFNLGITDRNELKAFVERKRETGIFLSVLGFGMGNVNDALMQALAQNGNGTAAIIDTLSEARKVLVEEATATLFPIAKDVKIQVEFNPAAVAEYRLIGYESRALNREDFENDKVDAGEVGSGQSVTALYEIVPTEGPRTVAPLRYRRDKAEATRAEPPATRFAGEYAFVKIRYKRPDGDMSQLMETPVASAGEAASFAQADVDARFATAVAGFGEILRGGRWTGHFGLDDVLAIAAAARGEDPYGYRAEFVQLVRAAKAVEALRAQRP